MLSKMAPKAKTMAKPGGVIKTIQKTDPHARRYIASNFITGKVEQWTGKFGWIKADKPIKDAAAEKSKGRIFCGLTDIAAGNALKRGATVLFKVYANKQGMRKPARTTD